MRRFRHESALYLIAFMLSLAVRLIKLGSMPLTDNEARWALQALGIAQGTHPALGSQPAYILLTTVLFYAYGGATNFLARLIPALTGSLFVLVPSLFAERLRARPAVILSFALALDPGLVALSRMAGSPILALSFAFLAWGFWQRRQTSLAGIFAGLALLSGPALWGGLLSFALTWGILQIVEHGWQTETTSHPSRNEWLNASWFAAGTIILVSTLFFLVPIGLSSWVISLPNYLAGWFHPSGVSAGLILFSLLTYQPLGLILAAVAIVRGWKQGSPRVKRLSLWLFVALVLAVLYPAHQTSDLIWMLIPLWSLAALELARSLNVRVAERGEVLGVAALTVLILVFIWFDFVALVQGQAPSDQVTVRTWLMFGSFFLLIVSLLLVAVGWSINAARFGAIWGLTSFLGVYTFGAMMGAAGLRSTPNAVELWGSGSPPAEADLLLTTVDQISDWSNNNINSQPVTIVGVDSPSLQWLLRDHSLEVVSAVDTTTSPPIVITTEKINPALAAGYRGQSFVWNQTPLWSQAQFSDLLNWATYHQIPQNSEKLIVWVRSDLFLDSAPPKP